MKKFLLIISTLFLCGCGCKEKTPMADVENKTEIIYHDENVKLEGIDDVTDEVLATLEKVPESSITYVGVGGYGDPKGMGVPFQTYAVGVRANPIEGYQYAGCTSETIEFFEYAPNEALGYDVPWFFVPDSGEHYIYVFYEPIK